MATVKFENASRIYPGNDKPSVDKLNIDIEDGEFLVLVGPSGCGKSTAAQVAKLRYPGTCAMSLEAEPTPKSIANDVLAELTGVLHWETRTKARLLLVEMLTEDPRPLLIFDELHLSRSLQNIEFIRGIHMRLKIPVLLVGDHGVYKRLSPQIRRRIYRPAWFTNLPSPDIQALIPNWHPIYKDADPAVIEYINAKHADGNLGNWSKITVGAIEECQQESLDTITLPIAKKVIQLEPFRASGAHT